ncbi:hypothetical protein NEFER03_0246 [Nematocida sp. LUAm3]|nr:hypothetical protein NEFER03_0246 [Nematocida sp. LUAm3]KAI5173699.1 hypothetical protein NEFER02_0215 [Nematocida sp. LUAm2]KAI5176921.1 hypothetical protein NEFER01_0246 [Nematocida sp. LUAm1]
MEYHVFKHPYILVEDETGRHRPFYREYDGSKKENTVPQISLSPRIEVEKGKKEVREKASVKKAGVCEMCVSKYSDYEKHIADASHHNLTRKVCNYKEIDLLVAQIKKEERKKKSFLKKKLF